MTFSRLIKALAIAALTILGLLSAGLLQLPGGLTGAQWLQRVAWDPWFGSGSASSQRAATPSGKPGDAGKRPVLFGENKTLYKCIDAHKRVRYSNERCTSQEREIEMGGSNDLSSSNLVPPK